MKRREGWVVAMAGTKVEQLLMNVAPGGRTTQHPCVFLCGGSFCFQQFLSPSLRIRADETAGRRSWREGRLVRGATIWVRVESFFFRLSLEQQRREKRRPWFQSRRSQSLLHLVASLFLAPSLSGPLIPLSSASPFPRKARRRGRG